MMSDVDDGPSSVLVEPHRRNLKEYLVVWIDPTTRRHVEGVVPEEVPFSGLADDVIDS
jgi:hypothetical protein